MQALPNVDKLEASGLEDIGQPPIFVKKKS